MRPIVKVLVSLGKKANYLKKQLKNEEASKEIAQIDINLYTITLTPNRG